MFIRTENEIISLMPTARWSRPDQLLGYLEEEERVSLEPLLGTPLFNRLCAECERLRSIYTDITATTILPTGKARKNPIVPYACVTERLDDIVNGNIQLDLYDLSSSSSSADRDVTATDMQTVQLLRICQQIEFYKMLAHKAGLLTVSFNEGGGMNVVSADGYEPVDDKRMERVSKDAFMSAGRAVDSLLLFLEADAKGNNLFGNLWQEADAFYLHKDLLFQTARVLNEYLDIHGDRMQYVSLVRDIRFCQNTYLKPRIGARLLKAIVGYANGKLPDYATDMDSDIANELLTMLRTALAFYVESHHATFTPTKENLLQRDSMNNAQQSMAMACQYVEDNLDALGNAAVGSPIYKHTKEQETQKLNDEKNAELARQRHDRERHELQKRKLFTAFPATYRVPPVNVK
jgi:hypothetical protein